MATWYLNGSVASSASAEWQTRLVVTENSQNIANNTSSITLTFQFGRKRSTSYAQNGATTYKLAIGGQSYTGTKAAYNYTSMTAGQWYTIGTWTNNAVYHNADGTLNMAVSASWTQSGVHPTSCSVSGTVTLPTIPRASSVYCLDAAIGSSTVITISSHSSSFTHTLDYSFGSATGNIATKTASRSVGWSIPSSLYSQIPNATTGKATITCKTYSGSTLVGTTTCTCTLNTNNTNVSLSATAEDVNSSTLNCTGDKNKFIKFLSNAKVVSAFTPSTGATIKSIAVKCGDKSGSGANVTLSGVTSGTITVTGTDSRGKSKTVTITKTMVNYVKPVFVEAEVYRPTTISPVCKFRCKGLSYNGSFGNSYNSFTVKYRYKQSGTSAYSSYTNITSSISRLPDGTFSCNDVTLGSNFDSKSTYDFEFVVNDTFITSTSNRQLPIGIPIIDIGKNDVRINGALNVNGMNISLDALFPVGSVLIRYDKTNPSNYLGGSWVLIENTFLWGIDSKGTVGTTGGEREHRLTVAEMPAHEGHLSGNNSNSGGNGIGLYINSATMNSYGAVARGWSVQNGNEAVPAGRSVGVGVAHNNMPPYTQVTIWRRIA